MNKFSYSFRGAKVLVETVISKYVCFNDDARLPFAHFGLVVLLTEYGSKAMSEMSVLDMDLMNMEYFSDSAELEDDSVYDTLEFAFSTIDELSEKKHLGSQNFAFSYLSIPAGFGWLGENHFVKFDDSNNLDDFCSDTEEPVP